MSRAQRARRIGVAVESATQNGHSTNGHLLTEDSVDEAKLLAALRGMRAGDFGVRLPLDWMGVPGSISEVFNEVVELNQRLTHEFERISRTRRARSQVRAARIAGQRVRRLGNHDRFDQSDDRRSDSANVSLNAQLADRREPTRASPRSSPS